MIALDTIRALLSGGSPSSRIRTTPPFKRILSGRSDANIPFEQARTLLKALGVSEDIEGDHFIYRKEGIPGRINIQPQGAKCKHLKL